MKTPKHCMPTSYSQYFVESTFALIRSSILLGIEWLSFSRAFSATLYHASHTRFYISSILHGIWLPISSFIMFKTFSMGFVSGEFPGHSRTDISLQSRNILVLLQVLHGARSCIKTDPFCRNTTHSHVISMS